MHQHYPGFPKNLHDHRLKHLNVIHEETMERHHSGTPLTLNGYDPRVNPMAAKKPFYK